MRKDLRELLLVIKFKLLIFLLQQKNKQQNIKNIQPYEKKFIVKQYISRFKFIMTPTRRKYLWSPSQKWNDAFRKTKDFS